MGAELMAKAKKKVAPKIRDRVAEFAKKQGGFLEFSQWTHSRGRIFDRQIFLFGGYSIREDYHDESHLEEIAIDAVREIRDLASDFLDRYQDHKLREAAKQEQS